MMMVTFVVVVMIRMGMRGCHGDDNDESNSDESAVGVREILT